MGCGPSSVAASGKDRYETDNGSEAVTGDSLHASAASTAKPVGTHKIIEEASPSRSPSAVPKDTRPATEKPRPQTPLLQELGRPHCESYISQLAPGLWRDSSGDVAHEFWEEDRRTGELRLVPKEMLTPVS
eukprot:TRINITY_DN54994_c0_g1_i1.p1 TRINITY_DN54994_c0_g1~~TRINITY_DN54994_c0_g1_i1.p1  ORF type:complete len:131 (-),score=19.29 TRINITY_DN54994_c0_g1_i1:83-475(-)